MTETCQHLQAIVLDWAGTTLDHGCCAPALVFREIFRLRGIDITSTQAREPMGRAKRDHIATLAAIPSVAAAWVETFGKPCDDTAIDAMYEDFLPMQKEILNEHCEMIPGVVAAIDECRAMGLKIGSSTGYTHELMIQVAQAAREQGYAPDCLICSDDVPRGRPAPYQLFEAAKQLDVYPMWKVVKVDDTPVGVEAGCNAGCWSIGVTRTGNCVGLSVAELEALSAEEVQKHCSNAAEKLLAAGAHYIIDTVADLPGVIRDIEQRLAEGNVYPTRR